MTRVHPAFGNINRGEVSRHKLFEVLETYRRLDPDSGSSASHFAIQSDTGRFIVRVSAQQLTLGVEGEPPAQSVPLAAEEIVTRLAQPPAPLDFRPPPRPSEPWWRSGVALVLLVAGVALMVHALQPVLAPEGARTPEDITLVTNAADLKAQQLALAGLFATGQQPGDRYLTISANGYILFAEVGPRNALDGRTDTFRIGRREKQTCLVTVRNGVIEVVDANTIVYYDDTYRRQN